FHSRDVSRRRHGRRRTFDGFPGAPCRPGFLADRNNRNRHLSAAVHRARPKINPCTRRGNRANRLEQCRANAVDYTRLLLYTFYFFAAVSICLGLLSLRGGARFVRYLQTEIARELPDYAPFATVFVPCR